MAKENLNQTLKTLLKSMEDEMHNEHGKDRLDILVSLLMQEGFQLKTKIESINRLIKRMALFRLEREI